MTNQDIINAARCAHEATRLALIHAPPSQYVSAYHTGFVAGIIAVCIGLGVPLRLDASGTIQKRLPHIDTRAGCAPGHYVCG